MLCQLAYRGVVLTLMMGDGNHTDDTIERLLDVTPSYVASALGRIALCLQMDFAPYIGLFINVTERCIPHECDAVLLMTEDRPVDMDGWEVAETVDDFGISFLSIARSLQ